MAVWMKDHGEGIFGTRPWDISGEGPTIAAAGAFKEAAVEWSSEDFRFTRKGDTLFAYQMRWSEHGEAIIRALGKDQSRPVSAVRLLGYGPLAFTQAPDGLHITLPAQPVSELIHGFAIDQR